MPLVTKIQVDITTGADDPNNDTRIFLGFQLVDTVGPGSPPLSSGGGREFRLRKKNGDANPFRPGSQTLVFGIDNNVEKPDLNDPAKPYPVESTFIENVYIRVSPDSKESWLINSATVQLFTGSPPVPITIGKHKFGLPGPPAASIVLQEDAGEKVSLRPVL